MPEPPGVGCGLTASRCRRGNGGRAKRAAGGGRWGSRRIESARKPWGDDGELIEIELPAQV
jgi:hypothetical protein